MTTPPKTWTDEELLAALREGGRQRDRAIHALLQQYGGVFLAMAKETGLPVGNAFDLVMGKVLMGLISFAENGNTLHSAKLSTYVATAVKNGCWAWLKREEGKRTPVSLDDNVIQLQSSSNPERDLLAQEVLEKVSGMGEPCRTILTMRGDGYIHEEIAAQIGLSVQRVKNLTVECRKKLINLLGGREFY